MKTPEQWIAEKSTYGSLFKSARWIAAIQSDAREDMVPAAELQAVEAERDRYKDAVKRAYGWKKDLHPSLIQDLEKALQPAQKEQK